MNKKIVLLISILVLLLGIVGTVVWKLSDSKATSTIASTSTTSIDESDEKTEYLSLSGDVNLSDYSAGSIVKIETAGEYRVSGTLSNGQIVINVGDEEKVQLYLNNAQITNNSGSAILVENAEKVIITLNEGTDNSVTDGSSYSDVDESGEPDAAIFSHDDLTINGSGSLTVAANYSDGIESRDDLKITGGTITVTAVNAGLFGNNSFEMKTATLVISAGSDTIHSDGNIIIESGNISLTSKDDGIHADGTLTINDGVIKITESYEGIEATDVIINGGTIDMITSDDGINGAGGNDSSESTTNGFAQDNFRNSSQGSITISGGNITITPATSGNGDGLDANGALTVSGGDVLIKNPASYRDYTSVDFDSEFALTGGRIRTLDPDGTYTQITEDNVPQGPGGGMGMPGGRVR